MMMTTLRKLGALLLAATLMLPAFACANNSSNDSSTAEVSNGSADVDSSVAEGDESGVDFQIDDPSATKAGSTKAVNLALLGKLSKHFDFTQEQWLTAIETSVPAKFLEMNKKAFLLGRDSQ